MTREEVIVSLGVDNSALSRGLTRAESDVQKSAQKMTGSLKGAFATLRGGLIGGGLLNIFGIVDATTNRIVDFMGRAKKLGKDWAEISVGGFDALGKLADAAERRFWQLTKIAREENKKRWAEEKQLIDERNASIKRGNDLIADNSKTREGRREAAMSDADAITFYQQKLDFAKTDLKLILEAGESREEYAKKEKEILDLEDKIASRKEKQAKATEDQLAAQTRLKNEIAATKNRITDIKQSRRESFLPTVDELAESGFWEAKRIKFLEADTKRVFRTFRNRDENYLNANFEEMDRLRASLVKSGSLAEDPAIVAMQEAEATLKRLEKDGIKVKGSN